MIPCTVFIDESGDLGAGRGTRWFVLTAVIVDDADEPQVRKKIRAIKNKFNLNAIHFRNVKDFGKRSYIVGELSNEPFQFVNVFFDTALYDKSKIETESLAYNYICRLLLERVSWLLRDTDRKGKIILSSRGTDRDRKLIEYIRNKLVPYTGNQIADVFTGFESKQATAWEMLQLADVCATSMFYSHEINGYGFITPCFAFRLLPKLYRRNNKLIPYGIKYFDDSMRPPEGSLTPLRICRRQ